MNYKIISKFVKDLEFKIPSAKSFFLLSKNISNYKVNIDIKSNQVKENIIEVEIKDQSDGIPEKYIHRLTERFFRVDKSRSKSIEGTGLGLTESSDFITNL